ncbi:hypothetical protein MG293_015340 [Ovis ammon polii]|uniref:Uncharacterized protein n=1 Tax=Ovis ammon polii TaxID=230172 RepID=A0AAD4TYM8_OVIAM|nr:hypothetical protein MG293_015340 [Ovis ammon polii]
MRVETPPPHNQDPQPEIGEPAPRDWIQRPSLTISPGSGPPCHFPSLWPLLIFVTISNNLSRLVLSGYS